jgi:ribosomal protein S18 acetylase RimI-like enzyme
MRHPEHDRLTAEVVGWYTQSFPELGYVVERRRFGFYGRNVRAPGANRVTLRDLTPGDVPALLADAHAYFDGQPVTLLVDDRDVAALLGPSLKAAGCRLLQEELFLAHVGRPSATQPVTGATIEDLTSDNVLVFAVTKLQGFADSEELPPPERVEAEATLRLAELAGSGFGLLARVNGEPAAALCGICGTDWFFHTLATRVPWRKRGLAGWLTAEAIRRACASGARAVLLNADPHDIPIHYYRRLGFTDEVYWRMRFGWDSADLGTG